MPDESLASVESIEPSSLREMANQIAYAYALGSRASKDDIAELSDDIFGTLFKLAASSKQTVFDDFIICLEDGRRLRSMRRYLLARYRLTPEAYRAKWNLPADYPMVAPAYSRMRSRMAKQNHAERSASRRASSSQPATSAATSFAARLASSKNGE